MSELIVVSTNIELSNEGAISPEAIASLDNENLIHGGRYATILFPEYTTTYREYIGLLMVGILMRSYDDVPMPDGAVHKATIFGFSDIETTADEGVQTNLFVPNLHTTFLELFDGNHDNAMHGYHGRLIAQTNDALAIGRSPYRLEPLAT